VHRQQPTNQPTLSFSDIEIFEQRFEKLMSGSFSSHDVKRTAGSYGSVENERAFGLRTVRFLTIFIIIME